MLNSKRIYFIPVIGFFIIIMVASLLLFLPINIFSLEVTSKSAILMDEDSGRILYSKNIDNKMLIASTTKIMTI